MTKIPEPTEEACRAAFDAFYARPAHLSDVPVAPPNPEWWPEFRDAIRRALTVDRERVARGES